MNKPRQKLMTPEIRAVVRKALKGLHGVARREARDEAVRQAFTAAGLRTDGRPRAQAKPCGCTVGRCHKCANDQDNRYYTEAEVAEFHAFYMAGNSFGATERKFGIAHKGLKDVFVRRGLDLRPLKMRIPPHDPVTGQVLPTKKHTWAEIRELAKQRQATLQHRCKAIMVPDELRVEWRNQTMAWRRRVIQIMRKEIKTLNPRPSTPFSKNVTPFEYGTPEAMAIMNKLNEGLDSQHFKCRIWLVSTGVIHEGTLYFWTGNMKREGDSTGYLTGGYPRLLLHHVIWAKANGRPVPAKHTVIFKDGNKNNFLPENLTLRSMAECAVMNSIPARLKKDPLNPELRRKLALRAERISATRAATADRTAGALINLFNRGGTSLAAKLVQPKGTLCH